MCVFLHATVLREVFVRLQHGPSFVTFKYMHTGHFIILLYHYFIVPTWTSICFIRTGVRGEREREREKEKERVFS